MKQTSTIIKLKRGSKSTKILQALALGTGILAISLLSPQSGAKAVLTILKDYYKKKKFQKSMFLRDIKRLQVRKLIDYKETDNGIEIIITKKGRDTTIRFQIDQMQLQKPAKWDKMWRLVMFDIPHSHKKARDVFREKLRELKFYPIQKSVFLTPYPCENEIDFLGIIYNIRNYILIMHVANFEGEEKLKHYFRIS